MGEVYRAIDLELRREVAIKAISGDHAHLPEFVQRFEREARALAALAHPAIAALFDVLEVKGARFLVMELVPGIRLSDRLNSGSLPVEESTTIALQLAEGLEAAHQQAIIHRDLKPANLKITPTGQLKILDFGLAKSISTASNWGEQTIPNRLTASGAMVGTIGYMSPEQVRGAAIDRRADIWAFGCILFELLAGKPPFDGRSDWEILNKILMGEPTWERLPRDLPFRLRSLLRSCLEKDVDRRLRHISEARRELRQAADAAERGETPANEHEVTIKTLDALKSGANAAAIVAAETDLAGPTGSPTPRRRSGRLRERHVELWVCLLFGGFLAALVSYSVYRDVLFARLRLGVLRGEAELHGWRVDDVAPGSPAARAGLIAGDVIRRIDDASVVDDLSLERAKAVAGAAGPWQVHIRRQGRQLVIPVTPGMPVEWHRVAVGASSVFAYWLVGLLALWKAPGFLNSRLLFAFCALVSFELALPFHAPEPMKVWAVFPIFYVITGLQLAVEIHLVSLVPRATRGRRSRRGLVLALLYASGLSVGLLGALTYHAEAVGSRWVWSVESFDKFLYQIVFRVWAAAAIGWLVVQVATFRRAFGRRQAAIVLCGVLPWAILALFRSWIPLADQLEPFVLMSWPTAILVAIYREDRGRHEVARDILGRSEFQTEAQLVAEVAREVERSFGAEQLVIFLLEPSGGRLRCMYGATSATTHLASQCALLQVLRDEPREQDVTFLLGKDLSDIERRLLLTAGAGILVSASGAEGEIVAVLLVGEKSSGDPYTPEDRELLSALARQLAWIHEHQQLRERLADHQRMHRDVVDHLRRGDRDLLRECPNCGRCYGIDTERCERDQSELTLTIPVERTIQGRYRLDRLVGRGGMGAVFEATDLTLERRVAVKVLVGRLFGDVVALKRFEREARLSARLHHPNVVAVHDYGVLEAGGAFLVMELLSGESLERVLERTRTVRPRLLADWLDGCCDGLAAAHALRIVHRDLKPGNIFITRMGLAGSGVKLLDFGLAKVRDESGASPMTLTSAGEVLGTVGYMAPEQLLGEDPDASSDLYSLGIVIIEALTGRRPFAAMQGVHVARAVLREEYRLPEPYSGYPLLRDLLERSIAKSRWERFTSAEQMKQLLVPVLRELPVHLQ